MSKPVARDPIYRGRRFQTETIELCVRWYITYRLSYRDLVAMMADRDITVSHTTIMRWVQRFVPEYERRWARFARPASSSWRMDETAVSVRGGRRYLYRAVDREGKSVHSLLCEDPCRRRLYDFLCGATGQLFYIPCECLGAQLQPFDHCQIRKELGTEVSDGHLVMDSERRRLDQLSGFGCHRLCAEQFSAARLGDQFDEAASVEID
jgi:hypothetical protein